MSRHVSTRRVAPAAIVMGVVAVLLAALGAVSGGFGGMLVLLGVLAICTGAYGLARNGVQSLAIRTRKAAAAVLGIGFLLFILGGALVGDAEKPQPVTFTAATTPPAAGPVMEALDTLEVKGRAPKTGYDRDLFGLGWVDTNRNGCDTRNDILTRDLLNETFRPGSCVVLTGDLVPDPYSGRNIVFQRGVGTSDDVQIDHVVALSDAWQKGAQGWDLSRRKAFANDPLNLLAVDGPLNAQKGDGDAATWLPPNRSFRCHYVARQVAVKVSYRLWVTEAERTAMRNVLDGCPAGPLPGVPPAAPAPPAPAPTRPS